MQPLHERREEREGVRDIAPGVQAYTPVDSVDILKMKYPVFAPNIDKARELGLEDDYIEKRLAAKEGKALFYLPPQEIGRRLGRTKESREFVTRYETARKTDLYERARRYELPREEIEERLRGAGYLGVSESLLIKDDEIWGRLKKQYKLWESYRETAENSLERERFQAEAAQIGAAALYAGVETEAGRKRLAEINKRLSESGPAPLSGQLQRGVGSVVEFGSQQLRNLHAGLPYAATAGGMAFLSGQAGPQMLLPEEALSVPLAVASGFAAGSALRMFEQEAGSAFNEFRSMKDENGQPMDMNAARTAAALVGVVNAGIENFQLKTLVESFPGGRELVGRLTANTVKKALQAPSIRAALVNVGGKYAKNITSESAQEMAQEAVTVLMGEFRKLLAGSVSNQEFAGLNVNQALDRLLDTGIETARSMALMMAPGAAAGAVTGARGARIEQKAASAAKEAADGIGEAMDEAGKAPVPDSVFIPRAAVEAYAQTHPGKLEEAGISLDPNAGTDTEVLMSLDQYEALDEKAPELAEAVRKDARKGAKGLTEKEL
jgi:hypothetical protein